MKNKDLTLKFKEVSKHFYEMNDRSVQDIIFDAVHTHKLNVEDYLLVADGVNYVGYIPQLKQLVLSIQLTKNQPKGYEFFGDDRKFVILHELGHVKQRAENRFQDYNSKKCIFDGKVVENVGYSDESHALLPHEMDANIFAYSSPLLDGFKPTHPLIKQYIDVIETKGETTIDNGNGGRMTVGLELARKINRKSTIPSI